MKDIHTIYASVDSETKPLRIHKPNCGVFVGVLAFLNISLFMFLRAATAALYEIKTEVYFPIKKYQNAVQMCKQIDYTPQNDDKCNSTTSPTAIQRFAMYSRCECFLYMYVGNAIYRIAYNTAALCGKCWMEHVYCRLGSSTSSLFCSTAKIFVPLFVIVWCLNGEAWLISVSMAP